MTKEDKELEKIERELKESEKYHRSLFNSMIEMAQVIEIIYDDKGKPVDSCYHDVNLAWERFSGKTREQIIGKCSTELFGIVPDKWLGIYDKVLKTEEPVYLEQYDSLHDKYFDIHTWKIMEKKVAVMIIDITERKKAEEKLKSYRDELELKVHERTVELDMLIGDLKRSNEELRQFAYVASHDLQEPLRTVASFTQLLERRYKEQLDSDADEFIDYIMEAVNRMQQLINDLLEFSRVTSKEREFEPVDVNEVLNTVLSNLKISIDENNVEVIYDNLPHIMADSSQLVQLFQNLIGNAIKFRKLDELPKIHISAEKDEDKKEYVFSVQDNGIGMEPQYAERIFTIFQRLHTREEYSGTGIGLAIAKRIVDCHNCRIWVKSSLGKGSTFYFTIPLNLVENGKIESNIKKIINFRTLNQEDI
ncbi:MAG: ATP-binding protein [Methanobacteriaceae archaeon]|nr:ATP-binding protein [Methanobacteriaceae archaeon]